MKAIIFTFQDGTRWFNALVPLDFDTQAWASHDQQRQNFRLLGIVSIEEHYPQPKKEFVQ